MNPIILALDSPDLGAAQDLLAKTRDSIGMIKIGLELWCSEGIRALSLGEDFNIPMFLDLKLCDIPNTVSKSIDAILRKARPNQEIAFLSLHCLGGREMIKAALAVTAGTRTTLAGVTLMTSLDKGDMYDFGMRGAPGRKTVDLAVLAKEEGLQHFVCSPQNIELMRADLNDLNTGYQCKLICPGIRSSSAPEDDQKRTKPVSFAVKKGADWLVIGRPITQHPNPSEAARDFLSQVEKARA